MNTPGKVICQTAGNLISGDRRDAHGNPERTFENIGRLWTAYLENQRWTAFENQITPEDVAHMMVLLKIARTTGNAYNLDNYVDGVGYMALAGEISQEMNGAQRDTETAQSDGGNKGGGGHGRSGVGRRRVSKSGSGGGEVPKRRGRPPKKDKSLTI